MPNTILFISVTVRVSGKMLTMCNFYRQFIYIYFTHRNFIDLILFLHMETEAQRG